MKAMVCTEYGKPEVLQLKEVPEPVPQPNEVMIRVRATTVSAADVRVRGFNCPPLYWIPMRLMMGIRRPRRPVLGTELSGEVVAVGSGVTRYRVGDPVFAMPGIGFGAYQELICLPENGLVWERPSNLSDEEAAALSFGGTSALYFLRKAKPQAGQSILIYGASGSVGSAAVQLARHWGCRVTAVTSTANVELVKKLGAEAVIDYKTTKLEDVDARFDIVFDAVGKTSKAKCRHLLAPQGVFVTVASADIAKVQTEDLKYLKELAETGAYRPVIDRGYDLQQLPEAHRYVELGHKKGNVVIRVGASDGASAPRR